MKSFQGIYAPILTPFKDDAIAFEELKRNLHFWGNSQLSGLVISGSNGESAYLSPEEKIELTRFVREHLTESKKVIAATGAETTRETIEVSQKALDAGAEAVMILPPHYFKGAMTDSVLKKHYFSIADAISGPLIIYNMPRNTGINLSAKLVCELAQHPNIVGIKDTGGNIVQIAEIVAGTPEHFIVLAGSASFLLPSLAVGARGGILAAANIIPDDCVRIMTNFLAGNWSEALQLQQKILPLNKALTTGFGISGLKAAMDLLGYYGGLPRQPLLPLNEEEKQQLKKLLVDYGFKIA
ncbi:MAG: 4-hydroxy-tetrahydrodipicolinate synthase [Bacillota bacterium]|jgi:4-hydroxy-2-oxoglutarate aldolase